jgi:uncharacterized protein
MPEAGASALYAGEVMHRRFGPGPRHALRYGMFSLLLDLDELPQLHRSLRWFSVDRPNLLTLRSKDHGDGDPAGPRAWVERQLQAAGLAAPAAVRLLTMPRVFGYAFNPLSVYYCHGADGRLAAVLYEVNSTFGERHAYVLPAEPDAAGAVAQRCDKRMHVSPFLPMQLEYRFRLRAPSQQLHLQVEACGDGGPVLRAVLHARRRALTDAALLRVLLEFPLLTAKVVAAIHWEALRLWLKGAPFFARPRAAPRAAVATGATYTGAISTGRQADPSHAPSDPASRPAAGIAAR